MTQRRDVIKNMAMLGVASAAGATTNTAFAQTDAVVSGSFSILIAASDAPQSMKDIADIVCSGSNDNVEINQAIAELMPNRNTSLGGEVQLSPGTFNISDKIRMRPRVSLIGSGRSTILKATNEWNSHNAPNEIGGVIEANSLGIDKCHIASLAIDGNRKNVHGIYFNITQKWFDDGSPDAANTFTDLYIYRPGADGIRFIGSRMRAAQLSRIRVWLAGGYGYFLENPDSFYSQLETGGSGKSGFYVDKANSRFTNCKAWFSKEHGFEIEASRNQFAACESQDNRMHGYKISAGQVTFTSCHADSNSWNRDAPSGDYSGFFIEEFQGYVQLIGCQAFDKNEDNRGEWQKHGFVLEGSNNYCQILGSARGNTTSKVLNPRPGAGSTIEVIGA